MPAKLKSDDVYSHFQSLGWIVHEEYKSADSLIMVTCPGGHKQKIRYHNFKRGHGCRKCSGHAKWNIKDMRGNFELRGWTLLTDSYHNAHVKMDAVCPNGHYSPVNWANLQSGSACRQCYADSIRGENHPRYKHIPDKERVRTRNFPEYREWLLSVYKRDGFKCQVCNSKGYLNAHHLNGYAEHPEQRIDVQNGVTLCIKCHSEFHRIYGKGENTVSQFLEWLESTTQTATQTATQTTT